MRRIALLCLLVLVSCATLAPLPTAHPDDLAPEFSLTALDGTPLRLSDLRGKVVILNFWATWCEPCRQEMPLLEDFARKHADQVVVIGMNVRESESVVRAFVEALGVTFPIGSAAEPTLHGYQVISLPLTFVIAPNGALVERLYGLLSAERLLKHLQPTP
ncbi:MAG: TlpA family protein disulfide reductase [Chloroflexi bacterium CFX4]|nr:TlpA family protein disulfide reductase [Chloroflexi bacterium CFX4]MDL1922894.1 TlpA family protein disulfide reductase [Chloroflexi bacterium CFX3]